MQQFQTHANMGYKLMATFLKGKTADICSFLSIGSGHLFLSTPVNSYWLKKLPAI